MEFVLPFPTKSPSPPSWTAVEEYPFRFRVAAPPSFLKLNGLVISFPRRGGVFFEVSISLALRPRSLEEPLFPPIRRTNDFVCGAWLFFPRARILIFFFGRQRKDTISQRGEWTTAAPGLSLSWGCWFRSSEGTSFLKSPSLSLITDPFFPLGEVVFPPSLRSGLA